MTTEDRSAQEALEAYQAERPKQQPAAVLLRPGEIRLEQVAVPEPGPGEVLLAVRSVGVCGSDTHYFSEGRIGDFVVEAPLVLGHESSGVVVASGPGATLHRLGSRVAIEPGVPCRRCEQCKAGRYNLCPDVVFMATPPVDGSLQRFVTMPEDFCHPVPNTLSDDAAALVEPLSVAVWAAQKAGLRPADRVLVVGAGPVGVLCGLVSEALGAEAALVEIDERRAGRVGRLGRLRVLTPEEGRRARYDVLLECSGASDALWENLGALRPAGRAVAIGMSARDEIRLPLSVLQSRELVVTGTFRYANTYPRAISLARSGRVPLDELVDAVYPLARSAEALLASHEDPSILKAVVRPWIKEP
jgi:L-iditol 2-dehydrogenase